MTQSAKDAPESSQVQVPSNRQVFHHLVGRLARELDGRPDGSISRGDQAALRREDGALSPTFYKVAARLLDTTLERFHREQTLVEAERRWARAVHALARLGGQHHPGSASFGTALASVELSEPRFLRLLRAEGGALDGAVRGAVAPLAQAALPFNAADLVGLLLTAPDPTSAFHFEDGEIIRRRLARDYYRAQHKNTEGAAR